MGSGGVGPGGARRWSRLVARKNDPITSPTRPLEMSKPAHALLGYDGAAPMDVGELQQRSVAVRNRGADCERTSWRVDTRESLSTVSHQ